VAPFLAVLTKFPAVDFPPKKKIAPINIKIIVKGMAK
jgi:hypothetical protein